MKLKAYKRKKFHKIILQHFCISELVLSGTAILASSFIH